MLASKRDCHGGHMADRPPPHTNVRNPAHLVNPVRKESQSRPLAAHISVIHFLFIFVSRFLHPPRHQHEPTYSFMTSKARHYPVKSTLPKELAPIDAPWRVGLTRGAKQHSVGDRGTVQTLASRRDCPSKRPTDLHRIPTFVILLILSILSEKNTPIAAPGRAHFDR